MPAYFKPSAASIAAIILFVGLLLSLRLAWTEMFPAGESPEIADGVLDLRGWDLQQSTPIMLDGQWEFFPGKLYTYTDLLNETGEASLIQVPGNWKAAVSEQSDSSLGYGTYRLRILTDPLEKPVTFWLKEVGVSSAVEINGFSEGSIGIPADNADDYVPRRISYTSTYTERGTEELHLLVRVANFDNSYEGGILHSVRFGSQAAIDHERWYSIGFQLVAFVVLLLHGLYACILYALNRQERSLLIFSLLALTVGVTIVSDHDNLLLLWLPLNYDWSVKVRMLTYLWAGFFVLYFFRSFSSIMQAQKWFWLYTSALAAYTMFIAAAPIGPVLASVYEWRLFTFLYLYPFGWSLYYALRIYMQKQSGEGSIFLLLSAAAILSSVLWGVANSNLGIATLFYPFDVIVAIICFSTYWFKKYFFNAQEVLKLNRQLREADWQKDQFLANTSHELRTPLHGIMNIAESVLTHERTRFTEKSRKDMELLVTISRRMSTMLSDLLDAAKLREHRVTLQSQPLFIQSVVPGVVNMLRYMHENKPIRIAVDLDSSSPAVMADEKRLVQILHNLLHNAFKFTERGTIALTAEHKSGFVWVHVSDTGAGMDQETLSRIIHPYEQGAHGIQDGRGLGLGLSICQQLIELHGGSLTIQSEPGRGSVFSFSLPLADEQAVPAAPTPSGEPQTWLSGLAAASSPSPESPYEPNRDDAVKHGLRILAVDDDPVNLNVLNSILSTEPYAITTADSPDKALHLLETGQWDLLIADVMMPGMSGYELTKIVRTQFSLSELPVLLLTARTQPADIYAGFMSGANDYVTKPVDGMELKYRIRALTGLKQSINELLRMEAAYLQAQIQPHFIFNTLNSIMALSIVDIDKMRKLGEAFATYLQISFDLLNTKQLVELSHELELVRSYLLVEKGRFGERLTIKWEVQQEELQLLLPPLTIQPLVENAVKHGLLSKLKGCTVLIRAVRQDKSVKVEVSDDGKGMDEETVTRLLQPSNRSKAGVGLYNTNRRLIQMYGQGLLIRSKPGVGTSVSFMIPDP